MEYRHFTSNLPNEFHIMLNDDQAVLLFQAEQQLPCALCLLIAHPRGGFVD